MLLASIVPGLHTEPSIVELLDHDLTVLADPLAGGYPVAFNSPGGVTGICDPRDL